MSHKSEKLLSEFNKINKVKKPKNLIELVKNINSFITLKTNVPENWPFDKYDSLYLLPDEGDESDGHLSHDSSGADLVLTKEAFFALTSNDITASVKKLKAGSFALNLLQERVKTQNEVLNTYGDGKKYIKTVIGFCGTPVLVDTYRMINACGVLDASLQHIAKKALNAGNRGHKSLLQDYIDIEESAVKARIEYQQKLKLSGEDNGKA